MCKSISLRFKHKIYLPVKQTCHNDLSHMELFGNNIVIIRDPVGDKASVSFRSTQSMSCSLHVGCEEMFCLLFYVKCNFYYDTFAVHVVIHT